MKSGIYGIRINSQVEVGYSVDVKHRWGKHRRALERNEHWNPKLQSAYNKYKNAEYFMIEETNEWLPEREAMWIEKMDTHWPNGYNLTTGGDGGDTWSARSDEQKETHKQRCRQNWLGENNPNHRKDIQDDADKIVSMYVDDKLTCTKIAELYNTNRMLISKLLKKNGVSISNKRRSAAKKSA